MARTKYVPFTALDPPTIRPLGTTVRRPACSCTSTHLVQVRSSEGDGSVAGSSTRSGYSPAPWSGPSSSSSTRRSASSLSLAASTVPELPAPTMRTSGS